MYWFDDVFDFTVVVTSTRDHVCQETTQLIVMMFPFDDTVVPNVDSRDSLKRLQHLLRDSETQSGEPSAVWCLHSRFSWSCQNHSTSPTTTFHSCSFSFSANTFTHVNRVCHYLNSKKLEYGLVRNKSNYDLNTLF